MAKTYQDYVNQSVSYFEGLPDGEYRVYFPLLIFDVERASKGKLKVLDITEAALKKSMEVMVYNPETRQNEKRVSMGAVTRVDYVTVEVNNGSTSTPQT